MKEAYHAFDWQTCQPLPVIGVDEVGRGCLAGPVYAAAVILDETKDYSEYTDSKKLTPVRRKKMSEQILRDHRVGIGFANREEIDRLNILRAALLAMKRAVEELGESYGHIIVDGNFAIPGIHSGFKQTPLVKGDLRAMPVAAASIVAKVVRDEWMMELSNRFPEYGFEKHKGYSTKLHKESISRIGPCEEHRRTFSGVKEFL